MHFGNLATLFNISFSSDNSLTSKKDESKSTAAKSQGNIKTNQLPEQLNS
jgi:hypothetical protein